MDDKKFNNSLHQKEKNLIFEGHEYNIEKMQASWEANLYDLRGKAYTIRNDKRAIDPKAQEEYEHKHISYAMKIMKGK